MNTFSFESFRHPPKRARPMVRWWWTGTDVERDELLREVREMDQAGFLGAEIQAFMVGSPSNLAKAAPARYRRSHRFMRPYYYEMVKAVLDEAARRDMVFDLTVCSAWPAGGVHVMPDASMKVLLMGAKTIKGGRRYVGHVPRFKRPFFYTVAALLRFAGLPKLQTFFADDFRLLRVVAARPIGRPGRVKSFRPTTAYLDLQSSVDLTANVSPRGVLTWDAPKGRWQVFAVYAGPSGAHPLMDAREEPDGTSLVLDHLARAPIEQHLEYHLGRAREYFVQHFGSTLRAFFTDSLELSPEWIWTDDFLDEFQARRGYDLSPHLPVNYVPGRDNKYLSILVKRKAPCFDYADGLGERIRHDFEQTVSDLFTERFTQVMTDWAEANGLQSRIQAYGIRADTLKAYGIAHIPETEQLFAGGVLDFLRLAGSAGLIYDKPVVTAESMVWSQRDYLTTPLKWKVAADRLFVSGINQMIYHGFPYQNPAFPYPGFDPFSSPYSPRRACFSSNFSRASPFWEFFPAINAYITRCQHLLQHGRTVCQVGLLYPLFNYPDFVLQREELVGGHLDETDARLSKRAVGAHVKTGLDGEDRWALAQVKLGDHLAANGYNYVHVNPERLLKARVEDGKLVVGAARLDVLVLSHVERITVELARKLLEVAEAGVPIVFVGTVPDGQPGFYKYRENDAVVAAAMDNLTARFGNVLEDGGALAAHLAGDLGVRPDLAFDEPQPTLRYIHKRMAEVDCYFLRHGSREPLAASVRFPHARRAPYLLNPWTGDATPAAQYETTGNGVWMSLRFPAYGSCIVAFVPTDEKPHVVHGDLPVHREGETLVAGTREAGSYTFVLDDGSERMLHVAQDAPPVLSLDAWRLDAERRRHDGSVRPVHVDMKHLKDWRAIRNRKLRHCSSKGIYSACVTLDECYLQGQMRVTLDLGRVYDVAVVEVNGQGLPPLLVPPYVADVTPYLRVGENEIRVTVTPTLRNRLIGYGRTRRKAWRQFRRGREAAPSGLVGPVRLIPRWRLEV